MATIVLSAVGAAAGASIGGGVLGLSSVVIGRAVGATIGQVIDQRIFGPSLGGSDPVETGRIDRFRLSGASEGAALVKSFGRVRVGGQVIWSSPFIENVTTSSQSTGGGKGGSRSNSVEVREYNYTISVAVALGVGRLARLGRIWADGNELETDGLNIRFYDGSDDQLPDAKIEAEMGADDAPAYRGTAYVVFEDLPLGPFGNRVPQFSFEVVRPDQEEALDDYDLSRRIQSVALIPGTGEYALATTPVHYEKTPGNTVSANVHAPGGLTDFAASITTMKGELPNIKSGSLVVGWFADDLRCGSCAIKPKVEQRDADGVGMPWIVSGQTRAEAEIIPVLEDRPIYGGTPADASVVEAIQAMTAADQNTVFYPFLFMEQLAGNGKTDPWTGASDQPQLPWRGRITLSLAPGQAGSPDGTAQAEAEVAAFFGNAGVSDFTVNGTTVTYTGPAEHSYRRYVLHYAHLCAAAGGVHGFCVGSELRSLTQIRGENNTFPAVEELRRLAGDIRAILGPDTKIGYAADWSEYFGYHPQDGSGDVYFHLDPLWSDDEIDFVGIDNYMPLADWREGFEHADATYGSTYNLEYLRSNIEGGEGFDWYYVGSETRDSQKREPITDGAFGEPWVYRYKDIRSWWTNFHHNRVGGERQSLPTDWTPQSKPIWFTEIGCPAVDKGANQPNVFVDDRSIESAVPHYSNASRDDVIQYQYLLAVFGYWDDAATNPVSTVYGGPMVDVSHAFVWAWDTRPFPYFPTNTELWSDGPQYSRGHWLNGRASARSLASVVKEICNDAGVTNIDVSELYGVVKGFSIETSETGRAALQTLMLAYNFDAIERDGVLIFKTRTGQIDADLKSDVFAVSDDLDGDIEFYRASNAEAVGRLQLTFTEADGSYETRAVSSVVAEEEGAPVSQTELPLVLTQTDAQSLVERWLADAGAARDRIRFALPPSDLPRGAGDLVSVADAAIGAGSHYRIERVEQNGLQIAEAVRVERATMIGRDTVDVLPDPPVFSTPSTVAPVFLDLPLLTGDEVPHAPHIAAFSEPWPGGVAVYTSPTENGFTLKQTLSSAAIMGETLTPLFAASPSRWDRGDALQVQIYGGALASVTDADVLNGANAIAIGDGTSDTWEVFQFAEAELIAENTYALSRRLRGQLGTDALIPPDWPIGSRVVLLNGALEQVDLGASARGLSRYYRVGPAAFGYDHPSYSETQRAFRGIGLRPYAPTHLRARDAAGQDIKVSWIRRTRIDGDSWEGFEVPLGEAQELYRIRVIAGSTVVREDFVSNPSWTYTQADQTTDAISAPFDIDIAQISDSYGAGLSKRIRVDV